MAPKPPNGSKPPIASKPTESNTRNISDYISRSASQPGKRKFVSKFATKNL